jgi:outer membrane immunogenic protein
MTTKLMVGVALLLAVQAAYPEGLAEGTSVTDFTGFYVGAKLGENTSSSDGSESNPTKTVFFPGLMAGYAYGFGPIVLGIEGFADFHSQSATHNDYGADVRGGFPIGSFMPYARIGFTGTWPAARLHEGIGLEYSVSPRVSVALEWTHDSAESMQTSWRNNSVTVGAKYYFR